MTQPRTGLEWYIDAGGRVEGPVSAAELRDRAAAGELSPTDSVSADRVTWMPAGGVPGLTFPAKPRRPLLETVVSGSVSAGAASARPAPPAVPATVEVEGYEIDDTPLGVGACGVVYRATHKKLRRVVALKTMLIPEKAPADLLARFQKESESLAKLQHPNIVAVYDSGECHTPRGQAYFAMELLDGEDLGARLDRDGPVPERTAWMIARQTAAALAHAAKHGIVHRDVKPANLFLVPPPTGVPLPEGVPFVKVTDFGLALNRDTGGDQRQSVAGVVIGTPVYMAPEQFAGSDVDVRADIYGLGGTVYHALTGAPAFDGRTMWDVMMKKSVSAPRLVPPISSETADLVASMLAIKPDDRPGGYTDLIARIDALPCMDTAQQCPVRLSPIVPRMPVPSPPGPLPEPPAVPPPVAAAVPMPLPLPVPAREPGPSRARWLYVLAAAALLGAGVAVLVWAFRGPPQERIEENPSPDPKPKHAPPPSLPLSQTQHLYKSGSLVGWVAPDGGVWKITTDDDKTPVLTGVGQAVRAFDPPPRFRVSLNIDPFEATQVDIVVATNDDPADAARWLIRIDRTVREGGTVAFGKLDGQGRFAPAGQVVTLAKKKGADEGRPYLELGYERADGRLTAYLGDKPIGRTPDDGLKAIELRLTATGGRVRIDNAELIDLGLKKK